MSVFKKEGDAFGHSYVPDAAEITRLIRELQDAGLIRTEMISDNYHGSQIFLAAAAEDAAKKAYAGAGEIYCMRGGWKPSSGFLETARLAQLAKTDYLLSDIEDFQGYWMSRRHQPLSDAAWDRKFAQYLKRKKSNNSRLCLITAKKDGE